MNLIDHLEKLRHFRLVALEGSFLAAAKKVHQSQPALMYSVKALETSLGAQLFIRSRNGVRLTGAGLKLLKFSEQIVQQTRQFESSLLKESIVERFVLATHTPYFSSLTPKNFENMSKTLETKSLSLKSSLSAAQLVSWVERGLVDISIVAESKIPKSLEQKFLFYDWYELYASPSFLRKNLSEGVFSAKHFSLPLIFLEQSVTGIYKNLNRTLWEAGLKTTSVVEVDTFESAASMAKLGLGIVILPRMTSLYKLFGLRLVRTENTFRHLGKFKVSAVYKDSTLKTKVERLSAIFAGSVSSG